MEKYQHLTEQQVQEIVRINRLIEKNNQRGKMAMLKAYAESIGKPVNTIKNMAYKIERDLAACDLSKPPRKSYAEIIYNTKKMLVKKGEFFDV